MTTFTPITAKMLGELILSAQKIREKSYIVRKSSDRTIRSEAQSYKLDHFAAAKKAIAIYKPSVDPKLATLIYLLNYFGWNDIQQWAIEATQE